MALLPGSLSLPLAAAMLTLCLTGCSRSAAQRTPLERGRYLVTLGGCADCHTPGYFLGKPDPNRHLAGSDVGFLVPGVGTFVGPNLTSDRATGLGDWTREDIKKALRTGERPDGRILSRIMPWPAIGQLDDADLDAIALYLKSLRPIRHEVQGPLGPDQIVPVHTLRVTPPDAG